MITHRGVRVKRAEELLRNLGVREGHSVLDVDCGTAVHTMAAARIVGERGTVHAVDIHPATIEMTEKRARKMGLKNVETIYSDLETGLEDGSMDTVLMFNCLKGRRNRSEIMKEMHRVVKTDGVVFVRESGMGDDKVNELMLKDGYFNLRGKILNTLKYQKIEGGFHEI